jgi:hypothetical protein
MVLQNDNCLNTFVCAFEKASSKCIYDMIVWGIISSFHKAHISFKGTNKQTLKKFLTGQNSKHVLKLKIRKEVPNLLDREKPLTKI